MLTWVFFCFILGLPKKSFIAVDMRLTDLAIRSLEAAEASDGEFSCVLFLFFHMLSCSAGNSIVVSKKRPAENQLVKQEDSFVLTAVHVVCGLIEKINLLQGLYAYRCYTKTIMMVHSPCV